MTIRFLLFQILIIVFGSSKPWAEDLVSKSTYSYIGAQIDCPPDVIERDLRSKRFQLQCLSAFGHPEFCSCLSSKVGDSTTFEQYIDAVVFKGASTTPPLKFLPVYYREARDGCVKTDMSANKVLQPTPPTGGAAEH